MSPYRQPAVIVNWACSVAVASPPTHTSNEAGSRTWRPNCLVPGRVWAEPHQTRLFCGNGRAVSAFRQAWRGGILAGCVRVTWLDDAGLVGKDDRPDPVAQAELGEQVAHMRFHGGFAYDEVGGDLGVGEAAGEPQQDVVFPRGQRCQLGRGGPGVGRRGG